MNINVEKGFRALSGRFDSEEACMEAIIATKWPNGFVCPRCGDTHCTRLNSRRIPLFECSRCAHQTSPLVGTIFEGTHLPLLKWFQALELFLLPDGISAMRLSQVIRVTYKTAWLMLHKIRHTLGEMNARKLLTGEVKVNCDQYGTNPARCHQFPHPYASMIIAGCTVSESGEPKQVKIRLLSHKRGSGTKASRHELAAFINDQVDVYASSVQTHPLPFRLYAPLRKVVREAWNSLKNTYVALGPKYLQAYLNEYTGRRELLLPETKESMQQLLLGMCVEVPAISYHKLINRQSNPPMAAAA